jgi:uncharacterized phiE125 gp8 family phage protein
LKSKVTTQPAIEPVSLQEVKDSLRITSSSEDSLITQYIVDARVYAENYTGRKFITQTLVGYADGFRGYQDNWFNGYRVGSEIELFRNGDRRIDLDYTPAQSITDFDDDLHPRVRINDSSSIINVNLRSNNSVKVEYVAGYGDNASDVPAAIRRGIIMIASHLYTNRGDCDGNCVEKSGANTYLEQYKLERVGLS